MISYNRTYLENASLLKKAEYWFAKKLLSTEQFAAIKGRYHSGFYSPALFVRIGLFIFTWILVGAALSLYSIFFVMANANFGKGLGIFTCLLFATSCFTVLELLIKNRSIFRSGIDEALLYSGIGFTLGFFAFIFGDMNFSTIDMALFYCTLALPILGVALLRFADSFVALCLAVCLYVVFFLLILKFGEIAKMIMPFALMLLSAIIYFISKGPPQLSRREGARATNPNPTPNLLPFGQPKVATVGQREGPWKSCFIVFECIALLVFYLACNYFVIRESSIAFFDMQLAPGEDIPLAILFYLLTALVPIAYVYYGLKRKDKTLLWIGLVLVAAAAITFKYYFSLGHPEITLTLAGSVMIIVAYFSIRYLKTPKHGITYEEDKEEDNFLKTNAEALVIAQSFSQQAQPQNDPKFGEGGFGGGGAGSKF